MDTFDLYGPQISFNSNTAESDGKSRNCLSELSDEELQQQVKGTSSR